jgi:hypothetical protein
MPDHTPTSEPCGGLPSICTNLLLVYCVHHQAWTLHHETRSEWADDRTTQLLSSSHYFGPFDDTDTIVEEVYYALTRSIATTLSQ